MPTTISKRIPLFKGTLHGGGQQGGPLGPGGGGWENTEFITKGLTVKSKNKNRFLKLFFIRNYLS